MSCNICGKDYCGKKKYCYYCGVFLLKGKIVREITLPEPTEKIMKFKLIASSINSIDISIMRTFFLFIKMQ